MRPCSASPRRPCPLRPSGPIERDPIWGTWEDSGDADYLPWDPSNLRIVGSETKDVTFGTTTHEWTITPLE